jgi:hypothetical protein
MYKKILLSFLMIATSASSIMAEKLSSFTHEFSLGAESMRYFYKESDIYQSFVSDRDRQRGAVWMTDTGNLYGLNGSYRLTWNDTLFIQPEGRILYGKHDYRTGRKEKVNGKTKNKIPVLLYEPRLIVGGKIPMMDKKLTLSPYTGIGYRFKSDDSEDVKYIALGPIRRSPKVLGYYRKSNYVYIPLGASADYNINDTWSISLKGEYDWIVKAWHYSRNRNFIGDESKTFKQPNGYGLKGEASVSYLYNKVKFSVSPYLNYWNIRNSKRSHSGAREPYNVTFESGIKLGVTF